jgi:hypothetical protein
MREAIMLWLPRKARPPSMEKRPKLLPPVEEKPVTLKR